MGAPVIPAAFNSAAIHGYVGAIMKRQGPLEGWAFLGWMTIALAAMSGVILVGVGVEESGIRLLIRATARTSFVFFISAFTASSLVALWPTPITKWMLRNRRYLGLSYATSHAIHLAGIVAAARVIPDFPISVVTLIGGGLAYVFIAAMAITSFDTTAAWLGRTWWKRLHKTGSYYNWFIFAQSYLGRAVASAAYMPVAAVLIAAVGLRFAASRRHRKQAPLQAASFGD